MPIWRPLRAVCRVADGLTAEELAEGRRDREKQPSIEASWERPRVLQVLSSGNASELGRRAAGVGCAG